MVQHQQAQLPPQQRCCRLRLAAPPRPDTLAVVRGDFGGGELASFGCFGLRNGIEVPTPPIRTSARHDRGAAIRGRVVADPQVHAALRSDQSKLAFAGVDPCHGCDGDQDAQCIERSAAHACPGCLPYKPQATHDCYGQEVGPHDGCCADSATCNQVVPCDLRAVCAQHAPQGQRAKEALEHGQQQFGFKVGQQRRQRAQQGGEQCRASARQLPRCKEHERAGRSA